jgi:acyl-CoA thioesterase FadM
MAHAVWSDRQQAIVADGDSAIVIFDYASQRPVRISESIREAIATLEGREFPL